METKKEDERYLARDVPAFPLEIDGAKESYLFSKRKKYIDFMMGWCVGNVGWNNKQILKKIKKFNGPTYVNPAYLYKPWAELAKILSDITPGNLTKSFRATGGTEAVEIALQAAMCYTKRNEFISVEGAYHGHSIGAMSVGSSDFRNQYNNLLPNCHKIKTPLDADAARKVEKILKSEKVAAFISEPIICNLGVQIPTQEFFDIVSDACKTYGTVLIMDEVATGFGRTGRLFATEHYGIKPDIMTFGKGLTGGYGGLGATVVTPEIAKSMEWNFSVYSTFGWIPLSVEGAMNNIRFILKNRLWKNAEKMGKYFEESLSKMKFKQPAEIRTRGLAIGIEFKQGTYATDLMKKSMDKGLLIQDLGPTTLTLFPSLDIDYKTAKAGLNILSRCL